MKYQRFIQFFLVGTFLLTTGYTAAKSDYELEASGKNEAAALGNLKMKALRTEIARHLSQDEIKSNAKNIRTEILLKVDDFVSEEGKISYTQGENKVIAAGRISVDDEKILAALGKSPLAESNEANTNASGNSSPGDEKFSSASGDTSSDTVNHETNAPAGGDSKFIEVQAEGIGESKITALKNAWSEAVRQAVGVYLVSNEKVIDDELVENIATYSSGQVESYKMLKADQLTDGWHVVIQAKIEKDLLDDGTKNKYSQKQILSFDGTNEAAKKSTNEEKKKNAIDVISSIDRLDMKDALFYRSELRKEKIEGKNVNYIRHYFGIDVKKYLSKIDRLSKIFEKIAVSKKTFYFSNETIKSNKRLMDLNTVHSSLKKLSFCKDSGKPICSFEANYAFSTLSNYQEFSDSGSNSEQCVVTFNSHTKITTYCFNESIKKIINCLLPNSLNIVFKVENSDGDIIAISDGYTIDFEKKYKRATNSFEPYLMYGPTGDYYYKRGGYVIAFDQIIDLSNEELINTSQLSASYEITDERAYYNDCKK